MTTAHDSFDVLYRRHAPRVFRRAQSLLGTDADAHEVVQDVFLSLFERPEQFGGRSNLTTFLYRMTTNACLTRIRNQRNRMRLLDEHGLSEALRPPGPNRRPDELCALHQALRQMPEELAVVAIYYCVDDLTHAEIARIVGCSRRHVANLLERIAEWGRLQEEASCC